jgi:hypothetical protein
MPNVAKLAKASWQINVITHYSIIKSAAVSSVALFCSIGSETSQRDRSLVR